MKNFTYFNPTEIHFGRCVIARPGDVPTKIRAKRVLLVYGEGSIFRNGTYEAVTSSLNAYGIDTVAHGGVRRNPRLSRVREGIAKIAASRCSRRRRNPRPRLRLRCGIITATSEVRLRLRRGGCRLPTSAA
jgi:hypothetical protein